MQTQRRHPARGGAFFKLLLFLVVLFAFAALAWMLFLPILVTSRIASRTGFTVSVTSLAVNPFTGQVKLRGLVVQNPANFPAPDFISMPAFAADADATTLFFGDKLVIDTMDVHIARITLVRGANGESNAEVLQKNLDGAAPAKGTAPASGPRRKYLIRKLTLRCDELVLANYAGTKPQIGLHPLRIDQTYRDLTDPQQLLVPAVLKNLATVNLGLRLDSLVPGDFGKALGNATKSGTDSLKEAGRKILEAFKGSREKLEESRKP